MSQSHRPVTVTDPGVTMSLLQWIGSLLMTKCIWDELSRPAFETEVLNTSRLSLYTSGSNSGPFHQATIHEITCVHVLRLLNGSFTEIKPLTSTGTDCDRLMLYIRLESIVICCHCTDSFYFCDAFFGCCNCVVSQFGINNLFLM